MQTDFFYLLGDKENNECVMGLKWNVAGVCIFFFFVVVFFLCRQF